jgi:hypothetical protein
MEAYATANTDRDTRAKGFGVRELRQACRHSYAGQTEEENCANKETAEAEQATSLAFSLSASLAFRSLSLLPFARKPDPTSNDGQ